MYKPCLFTDSWQYNVCDSLLNLSTATRKRITFTGPLQYDKDTYIHYNTESYIAWYLSQVLP